MFDYCSQKQGSNWFTAPSLKDFTTGGGRGGKARLIQLRLQMAELPFPKGLGGLPPSCRNLSQNWEGECPILDKIPVASHAEKLHFKKVSRCSAKSVPVRWCHKVASCQMSASPTQAGNCKARALGLWGQER